MFTTYTYNVVLFETIEEDMTTICEPGVNNLNLHCINCSFMSVDIVEKINTK